MLELIYEMTVDSSRWIVFHILRETGGGLMGAAG